MRQVAPKISRWRQYFGRHLDTRFSLSLSTWGFAVDISLATYLLVKNCSRLGLRWNLGKAVPRHDKASMLANGHPGVSAEIQARSFVRLSLLAVAARGLNQPFAGHRLLFGDKRHASELAVCTQCFLLCAKKLRDAPQNVSRNTTRVMYFLGNKATRAKVPAGPQR